MKTYRSNKIFDGSSRPSEYGDVMIECETINSGTPYQRSRPKLAHGLIFPVSTSGRGSAPEPASLFRIGMTKQIPKKFTALSARNTGRSDMNKGHIFALELGGPDVAENICPQFAQFQQNGEWRKMEIEAYDLAIKSNKFIHMSIVIVYGKAKTISRSLTPMGFIVKTSRKEENGNLTEIDSFQIKNIQSDRDDMKAADLDPDIDQSVKHEIIYGPEFDRPILGVQISNRPNVQSALSDAATATLAFSHSHQVHSVAGPVRRPRRGKRQP